MGVVATEVDRLGDVGLGFDPVLARLVRLPGGKLVDAVCDSDKFIETAGELMATGTIARTSQRTDKIGAPDYTHAEKLVAAERDEIIAPRNILQTVRVGLEESFKAGLLTEQISFAQCMDTLATRNRIYLFFATRKTAHAPSLDGVKQ